MKRLGLLALLLALCLPSLAAAQAPIYVPNSIGPAGPTGPPGEDGADGSVGPAGSAGAPGADGADAQPLLSAATLATSAAATFTDFVDAAYFKYKLEIWAQLSASDKHLFIRTDANNGESVDDGATDYAFVGVSQDPTGAASNSSSGADAIGITEDGSGLGVGTATGASVSGTITIEHLGGAGTYATIAWDLHYVNANGLPVISTGTGVRLAAGAISAIQLFSDSGVTLTGDAKLYGIRAH